MPQTPGMPGLAASSKYVPFVDGLRAVSILLVVAYHANPSLVPGGFVGVDVFFVISGYLIISQLKSALDAGTFSFTDFWGRRVLRILPTYLLVIVASMAVFHHVLILTFEIRDFLAQVTWSGLMVVNHYFLLQQGYFDGAADYKPLLHLWSLSVEEQFYLVTPLLMAGWWRLKKAASVHRQFAPMLLTLLFVASFAACIALTGTGEDQNRAFFLMPLRAWEFMLGGAIGVSLGVAHRPLGKAADLVVAGGMACLFAAAALLSNEIPFPSYRAALPAVGASLVILGGLGNPRGLTARALAWAPLVGIGLVSYAWYLWHWPVLVFVRVSGLADDSRPWVMSLAAAASFLPAWATYVFIERPIREWRQKARRKLDWRYPAFGATACIAVASLGALLPAQKAGSSASILAALGERGEKYSGPCDFNGHPDPAECMATRRGRRVGLVLGDSHATVPHALLARWFADDDVIFSRFSPGSCVPIFNVVSYGLQGSKGAEKCEQGRQGILDQLEKGAFEMDFAVLAGHWIVYTNGGGRQVTLPGGDPKHEDGDAIFVSQLRKTFERLHELGAKRILLIGPTPKLKTSAPECVARAWEEKENVDKKCSIRRSKIDQELKALELLERAVLGLDYVRLIDPLPTFCDEKYCRAHDGSTLLYSDEHHISLAGIERVFAANHAMVEWVVGAESSGIAAFEADQK